MSRSSSRAMPGKATTTAVTSKLVMAAPSPSASAGHMESDSAVPASRAGDRACDMSGGPRDGRDHHVAVSPIHVSMNLVHDAIMRTLPPFDGLTAFEAAARHRSMTLAANELRVTQSAISHRLKKLE